MRKIILEPALEFGSRCQFVIIDVTESSSLDAAKNDFPDTAPAGKKRGTITIDYAPADVRQLIAEGKDLSGALEYYRDRIYSLVKYYISGDWECVAGYDEAIGIVKKHIAPFF